VPLHLPLGGVAVAAVQLHRLVGHPHRHLGRLELGHRRLLLAGQAEVEQVGDLPVERRPGQADGPLRGVHPCGVEEALRLGEARPLRRFAASPSSSLAAAASITLSFGMRTPRR